MKSNTGKPELPNQPSREAAIILFDTVTQSLCKLLHTAFGRLVAQYYNYRVIDRVMRILERPILSDTNIGLRLLVVTAGSKQHGRPASFNHSRELRIRLIQYRTKFRAQAIPELEIQRPFVCVPRRFVQVIDHTPDLFQLALTANVRHANAAQRRQRSLSLQWEKCARHRFQSFATRLKQDIRRRNAASLRVTTHIIENKYRILNFRDAADKSEARKSHQVVHLSRRADVTPCRVELPCQQFRYGDINHVGRADVGNQPERRAAVRVGRPQHAKIKRPFGDHIEPPIWRLHAHFQQRLRQ